jgi:CheY-like chemotaxis protein
VSTQSEVTILSVDDDKVDTMAIRRAFKELKIANPIVHARNGIEALEHLRGTNGSPGLHAPLLVLLDLNMPRMGGIEFLRELRRDPALSQTLVFVLTTSGAQEDRAGAYSMHVAGYLQKNRPSGSFVDSIKMLQNYWQAVDFPD